MTSRILYLGNHGLKLSMVLLVLATHEAGADSSGETILTAQPGMTIGRGYNSKTGQLAGNCLSFDLYEVGRATGLLENVVKDFRTVTSKSDLTKHLGLEAQGKYLFAGGSASAKAEASRDIVINTYSSNFVGLVEVQTSWSYVRNPAVISAASTLTSQEFHRLCGDSFISGVLSGGEFYGVGTVATESESDQVKASASIQGTYVNMAGGVSVDAELATVESENRLQIRIIKKGSNASDQTEASLAGITSAMNTFEQSVNASGGAPRMVWVQSYSVVPGSISQPTDIPLGYGAVLDDLLSYHEKYEMLASDIDFILAHRDQFLFTTGLENILGTTKGQAHAGQAAIESAVQECKNTSGQTCAIPANLPNVATLESTLPLRYKGKCRAMAKSIDFDRVDAHRLTRGDGEIDGNNPSIDLGISLALDQNQFIFANATLKIKEGKHDWTTFQGEKRSLFFDIKEEAPYCLYKSPWASASDGAISANGGKDNHKYTSYNGSGLIISANCRSDTKGNDRGDLGCKEIRFIPITVGLKHEEDAVGQPNRTLLKRMQYQKLTRKKEAGAMKAVDMWRSSTEKVLDLAEKAQGKGQNLKRVVPKKIEAT